MMRRIQLAERCVKFSWKKGAMIFRRKLLAVFALTVFLLVVAVAWLVSEVTRRAFVRSDDEQDGGAGSAVSPRVQPPGRGSNAARRDHR